MRLRPVLRAGALAAAALVVIFVALVAVDRLGRRDSSTSATTQRETVPVPGSEWTTVRAGIFAASVSGKRTVCGVVIEPETFGVAHPRLPCGTKIFVAFGRTQVLTQVIDRGPYVPGRGLDLTVRLASELGLQRAADVRWRFAVTDGS